MPAARRCFPSMPSAKLAEDRIVDPAEVARRDPEVIFASWCGKKMRKATIVGRPGWDYGHRGSHGSVSTRIKSTYILQPGPASLTEGVEQLQRVLAAAANS